MSIRHALLALLAAGSKHGFQLRQEFESGTGEVWPLNVGQVYTTLQRLERDGLVEAADAGDGTGGQRRYRLTDEGGTELDTWLRTPSESTAPPRDELVIKVLVALRVPGVDVRDLIQSHRRHFLQLMQQFTRVKEEAGPDDLGLALVADAELFRLDAVIRWLDSAEARVRGHRSPPAAARSRRETAHVGGGR